MDCSKNDITISLHGDAAVLSNSTKKKAYMMFIRPLNIPQPIRQGLWLLHTLWIGEQLPKDRECFLLEISKQLNRLRSDRPDFSPVCWNDREGNDKESQVAVHSLVSIRTHYLL